MTTTEEAPEQAKARRRAEGAAKRAAAAVIRQAQREIEREMLANLPEDGCPWWCDGKLDGFNGHQWRVTGSGADAVRKHYRRCGIVGVSQYQFADGWGRLSLYVRDLRFNNTMTWRQAATDLRAVAELLDREAEWTDARAG